MLTNSWTKYSYTFNTNTLVGKIFGTNNDDFLRVVFGFIWGSSQAQYFGDTVAEGFGSAGYIDIAQVKVNAGSTTLPFSPRSFDEELQDCMRYFEKSYSIWELPSTLDFNGSPDFDWTMTSGTYKYMPEFKVRKRVIPTVNIYSPQTGTINAVAVYNGTYQDVTGVTPSSLSETNFRVSFTTGLSNPTNARFHWTADAEL